MFKIYSRPLLAYGGLVLLVHVSACSTEAPPAPPVITHSTENANGAVTDPYAEGGAPNEADAKARANCLSLHQRADPVATEDEEASDQRSLHLASTSDAASAACAHLGNNVDPTSNIANQTQNPANNGSGNGGGLSQTPQPQGGLSSSSPAPVPINTTGLAGTNPISGAANGLGSVISGAGGLSNIGNLGGLVGSFGNVITDFSNAFGNALSGNKNATGTKP